MKRVWVYEALSAGAWPDAGPPAASLLGEGLAMRDALAADLAVLGDYAVTKTYNVRLTATKPNRSVTTTKSNLITVSLTL